MMSARQAWISALMIAVFAATVCAQACFEFTPTDSDCPMHHKPDCCKHETNSSDQATLASLDVHKISKAAVFFCQEPAADTFTTRTLCPMTAEAPNAFDLEATAI